MKTVAWYSGICVAVLVALLASAPEWVGDSNTFLAGFVNHEYINTMGVILAITLASLSQIHLSLNRMEEKRGERFLGGARKEIKSNAAWLIGLFVLGAGLVVVKPIVGGGDRGSGFFNGACIGVLGLYIMILADVTLATFDIGPQLDDEEPEKPKGGAGS